MKLKKIWNTVKKGLKTAANSGIVKDIAGQLENHALGALGGSARRRKGRFRKGSRAAKAHMARLRAMRH